MKRFKKSLMLFLTSIMMVTLVMPAVVHGQSGEDLKTHWASKSIGKWQQNGIVQGYPDGTFRPDQKVTRAELVSIMNKLFGYSLKAEKPFSDIPAGAWYADALSVAKEAGYYTGFPDNQAKAHTQVTRQDAATMIAKAFALEAGDAAGVAGFKDHAKISGYATASVAALQKMLTGYEDGTFRPNASISRAELVTLIDRLVSGYYHAGGAYTAAEVQGNALVNGTGVVLKDGQISGNLYLAEGIAAGEASLEHATVKGTTFVWGGGENSIHIKDSNLGNAEVNRKGGKVRVVLEGSTTIAKLNVESPSILEVGKGASVTNMVIGSGAAGTTISGQGAITGLDVQAGDVKLNGKSLPAGQYRIADGAVASAPGTSTGTPTAPVPGNGSDNGGGDNGGTDPARTVHIVDVKATDATRSLLAYLQDTSGKAVKFGHQHDTTVSIAGKDENGKVISDVYSATGDYPAVFGWDTLSLDGYETPPGVSGDYEASRLGLTAAMKEAHEMGGILTLSTHPYNFVTGGDFNDTSNTKGATQSVVSRILPGGDKNASFNEYLNRIADFANNLKDDDGQLIPVIIRPFHEQNGSWFWWGAGTTTKSEYIELYRYTVEYLRDVKDVHNFLYAFSPNGPFNGNADEYLTTYPGDQYVDILGMDQYDSKDNAGTEAFLNGLVKDLKMISKIAEAKNKIVTLSEYGYSAAGMKTTGNSDKEWFTHVLNAIKADPDAKKISYMLTWANFGEGNNLFVPYKNVPNKADHELLPDFVNFYNDSYTAFISDMKDDNKFGLNTVAAEKEPFLHIVSPTNVGTVKEATTVIRAMVANEVPEKVTYSVDGSAEVEMAMDANGYYAAAWTPNSAINGGSAAITVKAYFSNHSVLDESVSVFVKVNEILIKKLGFEDAAELDQLQNNGTWSGLAGDGDTIKMSLQHEVLDGDGKLAIEITEGLSAEDTWQELKLELKDLNGVNLKDVQRVKFDLLIPAAAQNAGNTAAVRGVVQLPDDWNTKYGMDSTYKKLSDLEKVVIEGKEYYQYPVDIQLDDAEKSAAATGLAVSIVGSGLTADGVLPIYVDNLGLYNVYTAPVADAAMVDDFESYAGSADALVAKYPKAGGDDIGVALSSERKNSGNYGMELHYNLNNALYAGIGKNLGVVDWSEYNGLSMWVSSDGKSSYAQEGQPLKLVIQLVIDGSYLEAYPVIKPDTAGNIKIAFKDLVVMSWGESGPLTAERLKKVQDFKIYVNGMDDQSHEGTLYFDDIQAVYDASLPDLSGNEGPVSHAPGILYQFSEEADIASWGIENGSSANAQSPVYAADEHALAATFDLKNSGKLADGSSKESFELVTMPAELNIKGLDTISAKVKLSKGAAKARLFIKTGSGWTWSDSGTLLTVDSSGYTTITLDLNTVAAGKGVDLANVRAIGIKIEDIANDGGTAELYLQEIALAKAAPAVNYSFENGVEGWTMNNGGTATVSQDVYAAGAQSLQVEFKLPNQNEYVAAGMNASLDLSAYSKLTAKVKLVSDVSDVKAKLFLQLRNYEVWLDSGSVSVDSSGFATITIDLKQPANIYVGDKADFTAEDLKQVNGLGIQFLAPEGTVGTATAYIDEVKAE